MKFYDKELTQRDNEIKSILWILVLFIIGFSVGCVAMDKEKQLDKEKLEEIIQLKQNTINDLNIELDSLKETVYIYQVCGK